MQDKETLKQYELWIKSLNANGLKENLQFQRIM
jgi:hypothetical protein